MYMPIICTSYLCILICNYCLIPTLTYIDTWNCADMQAQHTLARPAGLCRCWQLTEIQALTECL